MMKVLKIGQIEDYGALSTFLSDKVDFKGDINNLFSGLYDTFRLEFPMYTASIFSSIHSAR